MNKVRIPEAGLVIEYPSCIDELSPDQWIYYCDILWQFNQGSIHILDFKTRLLYFLMNLKPTKKGGEDKETNIVLLLATLDGFFTPAAGQEKKLTLATETVVNLLPTFTFKGKTYTGPESLLFNCTFGTFLEAYQVYGDFVRSANPEALIYLLTLLYTNGDDLKVREKSLEKVPFSYALAAFFFFRSCVNHITTNSIAMYGEEIPIHEIFSNTADGSTHNPLGLETVLFDLGENGVFGNVDHLKKTNLFEVLRFLWYKTRQNKELKEKADAERNKPK